MGKAEKQTREKRKKDAIKEERPAQWEKCKARFLLSDEDVRRAKELGFVPEKLLRLPVIPDEPWKKPVKDWIHEGYMSLEKRRAVRLKRRLRETFIPSADKPE